MCDDVTQVEKVVRLRAFWRMLETVVLMRMIHDREKLTGLKARVSEEARAEAAAYTIAVETIVSESANKIRDIVASMDDRMRKQASKHAVDVRAQQTKLRDFERKISERQLEVEGLQTEINALQKRTDEGAIAVTDAGRALERLKLKLANEERYLQLDVNKLSSMKKSTQEMEQRWVVEQRDAAKAREKALLDADAAKSREETMAKQIAQAEQSAQEAEKALADGAAGAQLDGERSASLTAAAEQTRQRVRSSGGGTRTLARAERRDGDPRPTRLSKLRSVARRGRRGCVGSCSKCRKNS